MNLDDFLAIENKYGLVADTVDGFAYWTFFRYNLGIMLLKGQGYGEAHVGPAFSHWSKLKARLGMIKNSILFGSRFSGQYDIMILNHERRVWMDSHYECIYTDQIAKMYPDSIVLEHPYFQKHFRPVDTTKLVYTDYIEVKSTIYLTWQQKFCPKKVKKIRDEIYNKIHIPLKEICDAYNIEYKIDEILDKMVCGYFVYKVKRKEFGRLLDKYKPRLILEVVGYNMDCMIVNELTAERKIPSVELQHGNVGPDHFNYNYLRDTYVKQFPQFFLAFSSFWTSTTRFPLPESRLKVVGFPYLEKKAKAVMAKVVKGNVKKIIFISQGPIGAVLSKVAVDLDRLLDKEKYEIIYKLHPGEYEGWKERYRELAASGIFVADNSNYDLYELFAESTFQVGAYGSTATFEGLYFNLKTFILKEMASSELVMLCEKEIARFFDTGAELYNLIVQSDDVQHENGAFWKENALENMKREIDSILQSTL